MHTAHESLSWEMGEVWSAFALAVDGGVEKISIDCQQFISCFHRFWGGLRVDQSRSYESPLQTSLGASGAHSMLQSVIDCVF